VSAGKYPFLFVWTEGAGAEDRVIVRILHNKMEFVSAMDQTEPWFQSDLNIAVNPVVTNA
jgi:hypothetical protein